MRAGGTRGNVEQIAGWKSRSVIFTATPLSAKTTSDAGHGFIGGRGKNTKKPQQKQTSKIQPKKACQERKNLPIFTLSRLLSNTRLLIWLLSLH